jgi:hypothetical protein
MQSIAESDAHPSPQDLVAVYPLVQLHHWFAMAQWPVTRMKTYLASCTGPTPLAEEMRGIYAAVLQQCEDLLRAVPLSPAIREQLAHETAQLDADCHRQRTRKGGVRRRKARVTAADEGVL